MAITIANLIAQVGADLTQFRLGMNEVDARLHQVDVREQSTSRRLSGMAASARRFSAEADATAAKRAAAVTGGTQFSRQADRLAAERAAAARGDSDSARRAEELLRQRQALDVSPKIRALRTTASNVDAANQARKDAKTVADTWATAVATAKGAGLTLSKAEEAAAEKAEKALVSASKHYAAVVASYGRAKADLDAHVAKAAGLGQKEAQERAKASAQLKELAAREDELRRKHAAYLATLSGREDKLRGAAASTAGAMSGVKDEAEAAAAVAVARAESMAQDAFEHRVRSANAISAASIKAGLALAATTVVATKVGADFNQMLLEQQHNTTLSTAGITQMDAAVKRLGIESGAPLDELAKGFRRASDIGFTAAQSTKILEAAMKASVATGSDLGETTALLSRAMKEYNIPANRAADTMGLLVETSRRSALSMGELVHVSGQLNATASNLGLSFLDIQAALVVYTRHGLDASQASTQLRNDINKIINPSGKTAQALHKLARASKEAGVNLERDFTTSGLRAKGLLGVWEDLVKVAEKYKGGVNPADLAVKLFPNLRGTIGASIATGTGFKEYGEQMEQLRVKAREGVDIDAQYKQSLEQINQQLARVKNTLTVVSSAFATAFAPAIGSATSSALRLSAAFTSMSQPAKSSIANALAIGASFLILAGITGKLIVGIASLNNAMVTMTGVGLGARLGSLASFLANPYVLAFVAATAAVVGLTYALHRAANAHEIEAEAARANAVQHAAQAQAAFDNARSVLNLTNEYNRLRTGSDHSAAAVAHMHEVLDRIGQLSPGLVTGWDAQGHALGAMSDMAQRAANSVLELARANRVAALSVIDLRLQQQTEDYRRVDDVARLHSENLRSRTLDINGNVQREAGVNLGGAWRPATPEEISGNAPGLHKTARITIDPRTWNGRTYNYSMPQRTEQLAPNDPHMAAEAAELSRVNADVRRQADGLRETARQRASLASQPLIPTSVAPIGDPFGANKKSTNPGVDPLAGLYDKEKKAKKGREAKQTDAERLDDKYFEAMKSQAQERFLSGHPGKEGEALWETQQHGMVAVGNEMRRMEGDYYKLSASMKSAFVSGARLNDTLAEQKRISQDVSDKAADSAREVWLAQGQRTDREKEDYDYQNRRGAYKIDLNAAPASVKREREAAGVKHGFALNVIGTQESVDGKKAALELKEEVAKPLEAGLDPWWRNYSEMLEKIRKDKMLMLRIGEDGAQASAKEYADNVRTADSLKTYDGALGEANKELEKLTQKDDDLNKVTFVQAQTTELAKEAYDNLTKAQKNNIIAIYARADAQAKANVHDKEAKALAELRRSEVERTRSASDSASLSGPQEGRFQDLLAKAKEKAPETFKDPAQAADQEAALRIMFNYNELIDEQTAKQSKLQEIMEKVRATSKELSQTIKLQFGDISITTKQWDALTKAQKDEVLQLQRQVAAKALISDALTGLDGLISHTLDDLHEHGFKNFFRNVLAGFDDMIFQIGKKWADAQINKLLTNVLSGAAAAAGGGADAGSGGSTPWDESLPTSTDTFSGAAIDGRSAQTAPATVHIHVHSPDTRGVLNSAHQIAQTVSRQMAVAQRRG